MPKSKKILDIFPPKKLKEYPLTIPEEKPAKKRELKAPKSYFPSSLKKGLIFVLAILILAGLFWHFVLAGVEIEIWPETKTLNFKEKVEINSKISQLDVSEKIIPGNFLEEEQSVSENFPSSGKTSKKAQGIIRVYNNYHLTQTLVMGTRFQPPGEKVLYFRTTRKITVPVKGYVDVEVIADRPGEEYNIGPSTFSIPGLAGLPQYYSVYGKSFSPMTGGGEVPQVTQEDLDQAKNVLIERLKKERADSLRAKSSGNFVLLEGGISQEVIEATSSIKAGAEEKSFNFQVKIRSKALVFKESDLENFVQDFISPQIPQDKKLQKESLKMNYTPESIDLESGVIVLNLEMTAKIYSDIDEISLKRALLGKSLKETQMLLEDQPQITKAQLKSRPFWIKKVPQKEEKIEIKLRLDPVEKF